MTRLLLAAFLAASFAGAGTITGIVVVDQAGATAGIYDPATNTLTTNLTLPGGYSYSTPYSAVVTQNGNIVINDSGNGNIYEFDSAGNYVALLASYPGATGLALFGSNGILTGTSTGFCLVTSVVCQTVGSGSQVWGIAANGNNVYVASYETIYEYSYDSSTSTFALVTSALTNYYQLRGLAIYNGSLYSAANGGDNIMRYNLDLSNTASPDVVATGLNGPNDIEFAANGDLYIAQYGTHASTSIDELSGSTLSSVIAGNELQDVSGIALISQVPEPGTTALLAAGLFVVGALRRYYR